jgi:putative oxidoreductase
MKEDSGKLLLRISLGVLMLFHGVAKLIYGIGFVHTLVRSHGLPDALAYGVYAGEVLGPVLVILGWYSRVGAMLIVANMLFVFAYTHRGEFFSVGRSGGWVLELEAFYLVTALAVALLGPGRYAINNR